MKIRSIFLSLNASLLLFTIVNANCINNDIVIDELNTTQINLDCNDTLTITTNGQLKTSNLAIYANGKNLVINKGLVDKNSTYSSAAVNIENGKMENFGVIKSYSKNGWADGVQLGGDSILINNKNAKIIASCNGGAGWNGGVWLYDAGYQVVKNYGLIDANNITSEPIGINITSNNFNILNNGKIYSTTDSSTAKGISTDSSNGEIQNNGYIIAKATNGNSIGIEIYNNTNNILDNNGTIETTAQDSAYGIKINSNSETITNSGTINATAQNNEYSLFIENGDGNGTFINKKCGVMNGAIKAVKNNIQNDGIINLNIKNESTAKSYTQSKDARLGVALDTDSNNNPIYTKFKVTDKATFEDGTTVQVDVRSGANTNANLLAGKTLDGVITAGTLEVDADKLVVVDNSALLGFKAKKSGNSLDLDIIEDHSVEDAFLRESLCKIAPEPQPDQPEPEPQPDQPEPEPQPDQPEPEPQPDQPEPEPQPDQAEPESQPSTPAQVIDKVIKDETPAMQPYVATLNSLPTDKEVVKSVVSTLPLGSAALPTAFNSALTNTQGIITQRLDSLNQGGLNSGDFLNGAKNIWLKPYASYTKQKSANGNSGFKMHNSGVGIGADVEYSPNSYLGLGMFYSDVSLDAIDVNHDYDAKIYNFALYGSTKLNLNRDTTLLYQLSYAHENIDSKRVIYPNNEVATAKFNGSSYGVSLKAQQEYKLFSGVSSIFGIEANYRHFHTNGYKESGADALNLSVDSTNSNRFVLSVSSLFNYQLTKNSNLLLNLEAGYNFGDRDTVVHASYLGAPEYSFNTNGVKNSRLLTNVGLSYQYESNNFNFGVGYQYHREGSLLNDHAVTAKFAYKF